MSGTWSFSRWMSSAEETITGVVAHIYISQIIYGLTSTAKTCGKLFYREKNSHRLNCIWPSTTRRGEAMPNQSFQFVPALSSQHRMAFSPLPSAKAVAELLAIGYIVRLVRDNG